METKLLADDFLEHFGILGMHWGVHRARPSSADSITKKTLKKKKVHEMSDAELKTLTNRLQLEKTLQNLSPGVLTKGKNYVDKIIAVGATVTALVALYNTPAGKTVINVVKKIVTKK